MDAIQKHLTGLKKARRIQLWPKHTNASKQRTPEHVPAKIPFHVQSGVVFINPNEVTHLEAASNYTKIHLQSGKLVMISKTLKHCTARFPAHFLRIHQSYLINPGFLQQYNTHDSSIEIDSGQILPVSRACRCVVNQYIEEQVKQ
jgi:two-component system LytT family response regulator